MKSTTLTTWLASGARRDELDQRARPRAVEDGVHTVRREGPDAFGQAVPVEDRVRPERAQIVLVRL